MGDGKATVQRSAIFLKNGACPANARSQVPCKLNRWDSEGKAGGCSRMTRNPYFLETSPSAERCRTSQRPCTGFVELGQNRCAARVGFRGDDTLPNSLCLIIRGSPSNE